MKKARLAILDMYDHTPNQGMRCIKEILGQFEEHINWELFDVRGAAEVPDLDFDIYISTGGPGSPHSGDGVWDVKYYDWLSSVWEWNSVADKPRKYVFFICHSFQMACIHFELGQVKKRRSTSFGTFPVHMTDEGVGEEVFDGLPNPFYAADFRDWQVIKPNLDRIAALGAEILAIEKIRPHVPLERAVMAIRFSPEMVGVQFHPEADSVGMLRHFRDPVRREFIVEHHSEDKYQEMIDHLEDPDKIGLTHNLLIPQFLRGAIEQLQEVHQLV
ncbi:MAG: GMP synthase [Saprospiraceae bacterium]